MHAHGDSLVLKKARHHQVAGFFAFQSRLCVMNCSSYQLPFDCLKLWMMAIVLGRQRVSFSDRNLMAAAIAAVDASVWRLYPRIVDSIECRAIVDSKELAVFVGRHNIYSFLISLKSAWIE